jgi:BMFP domain-containing protein YqiC
MRRTPWSEEADEALDRPVTLTERQFRSLRRRGTAAFLGTALAVAGLALVAFGIYRVETTLRQSTKAVAGLRASLPESVRAQVSAMFDQATREEIRRVAEEGAEQTLSRTRGEVARLTARVRALDDSLQSALAVLDAQSIRVGALRSEQDALVERIARGEARVALVDSIGLTRDDAMMQQVADLGRRMQTVENVQDVQGGQIRTAQKKQTLLLGAVPIFLGPYIHILDHAGRR